MPTKIDPDVVEAADVAIRMDCGETCPIFPGKRCEDWTVDDPAGQDTVTMRRIGDDVDGRSASSSPSSASRERVRPDHLRPSL